MRKPVTLAPLNYITDDEKEALREFLDNFYCVNDPKVLMPIGRARKFRSKKMYQIILNDTNDMFKEEVKKMNQRTKECYYDKYCETCKHKDTVETDDPCNECLTWGYNIDSHKPRRYEEK